MNNNNQKSIEKESKNSKKGKAKKGNKLKGSLKETNNEHVNEEEFQQTVMEVTNLYSAKNDQTKICSDNEMDEDEQAEFEY